MLKKILSKILPPRGEIFFDYFEESVTICYQLASVFFRITHDGVNEEQLILARQLKRDGNHVTKKALAKLNDAFITPIDREDIQNICMLLNKISRTVAKGISFLKTYQLAKPTDNLKQQTATLFEACGELKSAVSKFKNFKNIDGISDSNEKMSAIETQGDEIMFNAMSDLFSGKFEPLAVMKLRDLHKNVEKALDLCFLLSEVLVNVSLKHT